MFGFTGAVTLLLVCRFAGGQNDMPRYRHAYQNAEDHTAWDGVTKANYSVDTASRFPDLLRQAFRDATTGAPGPVHLELRGNAGQMLDKEADYDLTVEERFTRYPAFRPCAEAADITAALKVLKEAAKPIIVVGGGAVKSLAGPEVVALADKLQIPIATSLHARALVPDDHALGVGVPNILVVNASLGVSDVPQLVDMVKKNPGKVFFASSGNGGISHLGAELFKHMAGLDIVVDGGVNTETAKRCIAAGADALVAGTAVFAGGPDKYAANIKALRGRATARP